MREHPIASEAACPAPAAFILRSRRLRTRLSSSGRGFAPSQTHPRVAGPAARSCSQQPPEKKPGAKNGRWGAFPWSGGLLLQPPRQRRRRGAEQGGAVADAVRGSNRSRERGAGGPGRATGWWWGGISGRLRLSEGLLHQNWAFHEVVRVPCKDVLRGSPLRRWEFASPPAGTLPRA